MGLKEDAKLLIQNDLPSTFVERLTNRLPWEYRLLYDRLESDKYLNSDERLIEFNRRRSHAANAAIKSACLSSSVSFEEKKLSCNGQVKLLVRTGGVLIIQEPMTCLYGDRPKVSAYKKELSAYSGIIAQLELDLGLKSRQFLDLSQCTMAVILHGMSGTRFGEQECELGSLMLGVPDAAYENWIVRLDLHDLAWFGPSSRPENAYQGNGTTQLDRVVVTRKLFKKQMSVNG